MSSFQKSIDDIISSLQEKIKSLNSQLDSIESELDVASEAELEMLEIEKERISDLVTQYEFQYFDASIKKIEFDNSIKVEDKRHFWERLIITVTIINAISALFGAYFMYCANNISEKMKDLSEIEVKNVQTEMKNTSDEAMKICQPLLTKDKLQDKKKLNLLSEKIIDLEDEIQSKLKK